MEDPWALRQYRKQNFHSRNRSTIRSCPIWSILFTDVAIFLHFLNVLHSCILTHQPSVETFYYRRETMDVTRPFRMLWNHLYRYVPARDYFHRGGDEFSSWQHRFWVLQWLGFSSYYRPFYIAHVHPDVKGTRVLPSTDWQHWLTQYTSDWAYYRKVMDSVILKPEFKRCPHTEEACSKSDYIWIEGNPSFKTVSNRRLK